MNPPPQVLGHWFQDPAAAVRPVQAHGGLSGAQLWRVERPDRAFVLRRWPEGYGRDRLAPIHALQAHLAAAGLPTPSPAPMLRGGTLLEHGRRCWELAPWMPGASDYWTDPRLPKLAAAMSTLARLHRIAATAPAPLHPAGDGAQPSLRQRAVRLDRLRDGELVDLQRIVERLPAGAERRRAQAVLALAERLIPSEHEKSRRWREAVLPLQWCLRDVQHDHVLFTGDEVTGLIDFGAAAWDAPAVDVARLLGSLVGDDAAAWQRGLAAYEEVRPLSDDDRQAIGFLDSSAVVLAPLNWLRWLYADSETLLAVDRTRALDRLDRLVVRLRALAARPR